MTLALALTCASSASASYYFDSALGVGPGSGSAEGQFFGPTGVGSASGGDTYVSEPGNSRISQFDSDGTFVQMWGWGVDDGSSAFQKCTSGCQAGIVGSGDGQFANPYRVAVDPNSDVYVADDINLRIQKFDSDGNFIAAWGWGVDNGASAYQICTSGCQAGSAGWGDGQFTDVHGIDVDPSGDVYVVDTSSDRIQKFDTNGSFLGAWGWGVDDGSSAYQVCTSGCQVGLHGSGDGQFGFGDDVATDPSGNVYVSDTSNDRVQKFDSSGTFLTKWGSTGTAEGQFAALRGIEADAAGNVYVADEGNDRVQKFNSGGGFMVMWGFGVNDGSNAFQYCQSGCQAGIGGNASGQFNVPEDVSVDASGLVHVANPGNHRVLKFQSKFQDLAGIWGAGKGSLDGQFKNPRGIAVDAASNTYVADTSNHRVQKFNSSGSFLTKWGIKGKLEGQFINPGDVTVDGSGNVYVADTSNRRVQKFDSSGNFLLTWGWGVDDGTKVFQTCTSGCQAGVSGSGDGQFKNPRGVGVDATGNVYVADTSNHRVQKFDSSGNFLTKWGTKGVLDGQFKNPYSVAGDSFGNVFVADTSNGRVQKFDTSGNFLIKWGTKGKLEGQFLNPRGVATDGLGLPHVADTTNGRVQVFERTGTFGYDLGLKGTGPGQFKNPYDLAVDPAGYLLVLDTSNNRIQRFF